MNAEERQIYFEGFKQGKADAIAEFKDLGKLYSEIRADAIDEFESLLYQFGYYDSFSTKLTIYQDDLEKLIEQLKE